MTTAAAKPATAPPRSPRSTRVGRVTSAGRAKTIRVTIEYLVRHEKYRKSIRRRSSFHAHDEQNQARLGDTVEIAECRPLSKTKHFRLVRVLRQAPREQGALA